MNLEDIIGFILGAAVGYYVVVHKLRTGKNA